MSAKKWKHYFAQAPEVPVCKVLHTIVGRERATNAAHHDARGLAAATKIRQATQNNKEVDE